MVRMYRCGSGWCCKEIYRLFFISIPTFLFIFKMFFSLFLCNRANVAQRTVEIVKKSRSRRHRNIIILTSMSTTGVPRLPRGMYRVTFYESWS